MARPLRIEFEDAISLLCARGNARQPVFRDERDCDRFLKLLSESAQREIGKLDGGLDYARRSATDSSNPIPSRFDCCQKVEGRNVKCLDLTPICLSTATTGKRFVVHAD